LYALGGTSVFIFLKFSTPPVELNMWTLRRTLAGKIYGRKKDNRMLTTKTERFIFLLLIRVRNCPAFSSPPFMLLGMSD